MLIIILAALAASTLVMLILWLIHLKITNAGLVDIGWAGNFTIIALLYAVLGPGDPLRKAIIAAMVVLWSLRLTTYLIRRTAGRPEEARYQRLREKWGGNIKVKFLFFFLFQGFLDVLLAIPILIAILNPAPSLSLLEYVGVVIWIIALSGESLADKQLEQFKADGSNAGKVCTRGLWKYSRHPNYFFEWLIWTSFFVYALGSPGGLIAIISPALMFYFLRYVTGIKATEEQALISKGETYRHYQETTSAFFPWFPKK